MAGEEPGGGGRGQGQQPHPRNLVHLAAAATTKEKLSIFGGPRPIPWGFFQRMRPCVRVGALVVGEFVRVRLCVCV